ncbi:chromate transporter [Terrihabitans sp. B22-R8]|uniref:chromate transporter n=1 Tax=Terrihabitans sp. B22-R8 TaxID=3425128 RepID=UPI00403CB26F
MTDDAALVRPSLAELFLGFFGISVIGFGGVLPWARWMMVERRRWLEPREFAEMLSLCQFLPGGNIVNLAIIVGHRMHGLIGAVVAFLALMAGPFVIVLVLGAVYARYADLPEFKGALAAIGAAAAGLVVSMAVKMAASLREEPFAILPAAAAFVSVGIFRISLIATVAILAPLTIAYAWRRVR